MAIRSFTYSTGLTLAAVIRDVSTGTERIWNTGTAAFEAYSAANIALYGIAATEGSPGNYHWTVPATLPASASGYPYEATAYEVAGASLAVSDLATPAVADTFAWTGTGFSEDDDDDVDAPAEPATVTINLVIDGDTPASVALNSVVRMDTEAEVLSAPPVAMTFANGAWSYTFDETAAGLTYRYEAAITWDDGSITEIVGTQRGTIAADGYYPERSQVRQGMGAANFDALANLDNADADAPDEDVVAQAFAWADAYVDGRALFYRLTADADATAPHYISSTNAIWEPLRLWASELAGVKIFRLRGITRVGDGAQAEGQMADKYKEAVLRIDELLQAAYQTQLAAADGSFGYGAEVIQPACGCYPPDVVRPICGC